jgi:thymidylate synthase ThyX
VKIDTSRIYAKIIADSIGPTGVRLTTLEICLWRSMLAELNTHRVFSRNSASSRAIPLDKQLARIEESVAGPVLWPREQRGMQGGGEVEPETQERALEAWEQARDGAIKAASWLGRLGVHKSVASRLLEPFMWHTVVITATSFENFFRLRVDAAAQPDIRAAAEAMQEAYEASEPTFLDYGRWHLPYIQREDITAAEEYLLAERGQGNYGSSHVTQTLVQMSSAKCARVSYLNHDGQRDVADEIRLYESLTTNGHASPLEHVATPAENMHQVEVYSQFDPRESYTLTLPLYGNLLGWHQHRFDVEAARRYQSYA